MDVHCEGATITIDGHSLVLPEEPAAVVECGSLVVVRFDYTSEAIDVSRNVWAFDSTGERVWRIERGMELDGEYDSYSGIGVVDNDELWAYSWKGFDYRVCSETGEHEERLFSR